MTRKYIREAYDAVAPTSEEKAKMLHAILSAVPNEKPLRKEVNMKKYTKKPLVLAALVTLMVFLMGCAVVGLTLQDMKLDQHEGYAGPGETTKVWDVISLQGVVGSPEYQANQEWREFRAGYDPDGKKAISAQFHRYEAPAEYDTFACYSQELMDKLDDICMKYDLKLPGRGWKILHPEDIFTATGIDDIRRGTRADVDLQYGYCYADGSFNLRGSAKFPGQASGDMLSINCVRKGSFNVDTESVSNVAEFDQWNYTMKDGTKILLANVRGEVIMAADLEDYFITVCLYGEGCNFVQGQEERRRATEDMAECFDFSVTPQKADTAVLEAAQKDWEEMWADYEKQEDRDFIGTSYNIFPARGYLTSSGTQYAMADLTGDGIDELILTTADGEIRNILTFNGEHTSLLMAAHRIPDVLNALDGAGLHMAEGGILYQHATCGDCHAYSYYHLENGEYKLFDFVEYHAETGKWSRSQDGDKTCETILTEAEAKSIIDSYTPMDLTFQPLTQFPND